MRMMIMKGAYEDEMIMKGAYEPPGSSKC